MAMIDLELFQVALANIRGRQLRSFLTILGIIIGIAAIVALISVGEGLQRSVSSEFESLGQNTLVVLPGGGFAETLFAKLEEDDVETIERVRGVDFAAALYVATLPVEFRGETQTSVVMGIDPEKRDKLEVIGIGGIAEGRSLTGQDSSSVVLGSDFAEDILKEEVGLRQGISIGGQKFRVVGIMDESSNTFGAILNTALLLTDDALKETSPEPLTPFRIVVSVLPSEDISEVKERVSDELERVHNKKDFQVIELQQVGEIAGQVVGLISLVLVGIAAISLLVGGIGIMNTMLMSVLERTREVGVMKAIGATTWKITSIFIVEAGIIGLVGGVIGLLLGIGAASVFSLVAEFAGLPLTAYVSPWLIVFALAFSMAVGMLFGVYPARRAARIDPVEALRYE